MTLSEEKAFFLDRQAAYLATGDVVILWRDMLPYIEKVCRSCLKKISNGHFVHDLDVMTEEAADTIIKRYLKKAYKNGNPESMCRWACYKVYYSDKEKSLEMEREIIANVRQRGNEWLHRPE